MTIDQTGALRTSSSSMPYEDRETLPVREVARLLGIGERSVHRLAQHLRPSLSSTGHRLYRRDVVEAFAAHYDVKRELKAIRRKARKALRAEEQRQRDEQVAQRLDEIVSQKESE